MGHTLQQVRGRRKHIKEDSRDACVRDMAWWKKIAILILASLFSAGELGITKNMNHDLIYMSVKWFVRICEDFILLLIIWRKKKILNVTNQQ